MKSSIKYFLSAVFAVSSSLFLIDCQTDLPNLNVIAAPNFMTNVTTVKFSETAGDSGLYTGVDGTQVTVTGPDAEFVYNLSGQKTYVIQGGTVGLLLDPVKNFTDKESYTVYLNFNKNGFLSRIIPVTFTKNNPDGFVAVNLVRLSAPPAGVEVKQASGTMTASSGLQETITLETAPSNSQNETATLEVVIPKSIGMKSESGEALAGPVKVTAVTFPETGSGTNFFPGSLQPENVKLADGTIAPKGEFVTAGFAALEMTVGGVPVSNFTGGTVSLKINIANNAINPKTYTAFKAGDKIDVWSYNQTSGRWSFQQEGTVAAGANTGDPLYVAFETSHLSYFALASFGEASTSLCDKVDLKINWTGVSESASVKCKFVFSYNDGTSQGDWTQVYDNREAFIYDGKVITLKNVTKRPSQVEIYNLDSNVKLGTFKFQQNELCSAGVKDITITTPAPVAGTMITCSYTAKCAQGYSVLPPVGTTVYYKETGSTSSLVLLYTVTTENVSNLNFLTDKLKVGKSYDFKIYSGVKTPVNQTHTITLNANNEFHLDFTLTESQCNKL